MKIITNNVPREVIREYELTEKERKEFDYLGEDGGYFFRYKGEVYDLGEFTTTSGLDGTFDLWDGYHSDTFFSGILVRYPRTDRGTFDSDNDTIIVGRYYS